jgi:hypothetical protein
MSVAPDIIAADNRSSFDPQQAATLLDQSAQQARRQLEPFAFGVVNLGVTVGVAKRATAGVSGRSRLHPAEIAIVAAAWAGVFAVMGVLAGEGVSRGFVYGVYPMTVPLIVAGLAWAAITARRAKWRQFGTAVAVVVVGIAGAFAGPAGAWAVAGAGLCLALIGSAAAVAWRQRRGVAGS